MYTNNNIDIYHFLLDLKFGLPALLKTSLEEFVLIASSENVTEKSLNLMRTLSASTISVIINSRRMSFITQKVVKEDLYSISFSNKIDSELAKNISSSMVENNYLKDAIISVENRPEIKNLIYLMKINQMIPSLVFCNLSPLKKKESDFNFTNYNIKTYQNIDILNGLKEGNEFKIISRSHVPISACKDTEIVSFRSKNDHSEYFAIILKKAHQKKTPLVRIHSQCITGDILDSLKCDCGSQLKKSIEMMAKDGGILVYMPEEGRNIGLLNKLRAYEFQFHGIDTIDANYALGFDADQRKHEYACNILNLLGVDSIELLTNNPKKVSQIKKSGVKIIKTIQLKVDVAPEAEKYIQTKKVRTGHDL